MAGRMIQPVTARGFGDGIDVAAGGVVPARQVEQPAHGPRAASVSALAELVGQPGGVGAAFLPALGQVGGVCIQFAAPAGRGGEQIVCARGARVAQHGLVVQVQRSADRGRADTLVRQRVDLGPSLTGQLGSASLGCIWRGRLGDRVGRWLLCQALAVGAHHSIDRVGELVEQVESVGYLDRVRGAEPCAFAVASGAVSTDHLCAGVGAQALGEGVGQAGRAAHRPAGGSPCPPRSCRTCGPGGWRNRPPRAPPPRQVWVSVARE